MFTQGLLLIRKANFGVSVTVSSPQIPLPYAKRLKYIRSKWVWYLLVVEMHLTRSVGVLYFKHCSHYEIVSMCCVCVVCDTLCRSGTEDKEVVESEAISCL
jgi:hypothetical protein